MPQLVSFFRRDFAAYIPRKSVSFGFWDEISMLDAASNRGRPIFARVRRLCLTATLSYLIVRSWKIFTKFPKFLNVIIFQRDFREVKPCLNSFPLIIFDLLISSSVDIFAANF